MYRKLPISLVFAMVAAAGACGPDDRPAPVTDQPATTQPAPTTTDPAMLGQLPPGVTAEMVSQGRQLYGTVCVACHGADGAGTPLGPAMNDQQWIHITGEFEEIVNITRTGVPTPQQYPAPMPPMGGGSFSDEQVRSIAAYVYSLSHGR